MSPGPAHLRGPTRPKAEPRRTRSPAPLRACRARVPRDGAERAVPRTSQAAAHAPRRARGAGAEFGTTPVPDNPRREEVPRGAPFASGLGFPEAFPRASTPSAMPPRHILCPSCGFKNDAPLPNQRCVSCGARIEDARRSMSRREEQDRRYRQDAFSPVWFLMSLLVVGVLTAAVVVGVPIVVPLFDFEGSAGMRVAIPVWFSAGLLVGLISPGRTYIEPVLATFLVAMPTALLL